MLELIGGGLMGSALGGLLRLTPEVLKWLDRKDERKHELAMFDKQVGLEITKGKIKLDEIGAQHTAAVDSGVISAFQSAIQQQADMAKAAGGWAASLSASVRPITTYWILALWSIIHLAFLMLGYQAGLPPLEMFQKMMSPDFVALVSGTLNYWYLDRTIAKRGL